MVLLYIDDDPDDIEIFRDAVNVINPAFKCLSARHGEEALNILNAGVLPDAIFLDINMPVMNGRDTLEEIRRNEALKDIPVIIYSTTMNPIEIEACKKIGATEFLIKPARFYDLRDAIAGIISRYQ